MRMISIEQQFAEKLHAYSLPREQRSNSRVKDLLDMLLLIKSKKINPTTFTEVVQKVFKVRNTHPRPKSLQKPPQDWEPIYQKLSAECEMEQTMFQAFSELSQFFLECFPIKKEES